MKSILKKQQKMNNMKNEILKTAQSRTSMAVRGWKEQNNFTQLANPTAD